MALAPTLKTIELGPRNQSVPNRRRFLKSASVLTADHASQTDREGYQNELGNQKTPLLFRPGRPLPPANVRRITQHADVPATVLDLLGLPQERKLLPFGSSVFDSASPGRALFVSADSYYLVHSDFVTELKSDNRVYK